MRLIPFVAVLAAAAGAAASNPVQAQGFFIDGRVGQSELRDVPGARDDTGYAVGAGWWFNRNFAVEGGWGDLYSRGYPAGRLALDGFYAGVKGRALFAQRGDAGFFVGGRGGLYSWTGRAAQFETDGNDWYAGVFTGYQFSNRIALSVNYDRFRADDLDTDLASVGLEYTF